MTPIPKEFVELCIWFQPGLIGGHETAEQVIEDALSIAKLSVAQRNVVRAYLDELLSGKYNDEELERIWRKSGAGVSILTDREGNAANFLRRIRSVIDDLARRSQH
jgi:hypothetical protein